MISDSDSICININEVYFEGIEYMEKIKAETPLNHMINAEETAPHTVNIKVIK